MRQLIKSEKGTAIVEATMLLPFCILMVLASYYALQNSNACLITVILSNTELVIFFLDGFT